MRFGIPRRRWGEEGWREETLWVGCPDRKVGWEKLRRGRKSEEVREESDNPNRRRFKMCKWAVKAIAGYHGSFERCLNVTTSGWAEPPIQKMSSHACFYTQTHTYTHCFLMLSASSMCWVGLSDFWRLVKCNHSYLPYSPITARTNGMLTVQRHGAIVFILYVSMFVCTCCTPTILLRWVWIDKRVKGWIWMPV